MLIRVIDGIPTGSPQSFSANVNLSSDWKIYNPLTEEYDQIKYYPQDRYDLETDQVYQELILVPNLDEVLVNEARVIRNELLARSDWTQLPDSPLSDSDKSDWQAYRRSLRDITGTIEGLSSLDEIVWPTKPE